MDQPLDMTTEYIRNEKIKILKALIPFSTTSSSQSEATLSLQEESGPSSPPKIGGVPTAGGGSGINTPWVVRGQYQGYTKDVKGESGTETFVALKSFINTPRWKGVPVYMRTGKALSKKLAEVSVHFKEPDRCIFRHCAPNILTFRIQPDESVHLQLNNKVPGFGIDLHQGDYEFGYNKAFMSEIPSAYERLLLDFMEGDQRLFIRSDEIEAAWRFIDSITNSWKNLPLHVYKPGTNGPEASGQFIKKDGKEWWTK